MRRTLLLGLAILLLAPACVNPYLRFPFPDRPGITAQWPVRGTGTPAQPPPRQMPCREISRLPCDLLHCGEPGRDFVTTQCAGSPAIAGKCEPNGGCGIEAKGEEEEGT